MSAVASTLDRASPGPRCPRLVPSLQCGLPIGNPTDPLEVAEVSYTLVCAEDLPAINATNTIGLYLLREKGTRRLTAIMRRHSLVWVVMYFAGIVYRMYAMIMPARYSGYWWLVLSFILQFPSVSFVALNIRYEFVRQLMKSFEFWFFSAVNVLWVVSLFIGYQDSRVVVCFMSLVELENAKLTDANAQRLQFITLAALLSCAALGITIVGILINSIDLHNPVVWKTPRGPTLALNDLLVNAMATIALLMARIAYRKRYAWRHTDNAYVQCVTCRCRIKFAPSGLHGRIQVTQAQSLISEEQVVRQASSTALDPITTRAIPPKLCTIQLEYAAIPTVFTADRVLGGREIAHRRLYRWARISWMILSISAVVGLLGLAATAPISKDDSTSVPWLAPLTISLTVSAALPFLALHQTQLLRCLFNSFDFLFLLLQNVLTGFAVCHLVHWRFDQVAIVICVTVWFYVMITYDALTPAAKQVLRWTPARATLLSILMLGSHLALVALLTLTGGWDIEDRVLIHVSLFGHRIQVFVIPFLLSRLLILVIWNCRIVYRLAACSRRPGGELELITLLGAVQYKRQRSSSLR